MAEEERREIRLRPDHFEVDREGNLIIRSDEQIHDALQRAKLPSRMQQNIQIS